MGIALVEDVEGNLGVLDRRKTADQPHLGVDDGVTDPVQVLADIHLDLPLLHQAEDERGAVERVDPDAILRARDRHGRHDELGHAVVDYDDVVDAGVGQQGGLDVRLDPGRPVDDRNVDLLPPTLGTLLELRRDPVHHRDGRVNFLRSQDDRVELSPRLHHGPVDQQLAGLEVVDRDAVHLEGREVLLVTAQVRRDHSDPSLPRLVDLGSEDLRLRAGQEVDEVHLLADRMVHSLQPLGGLPLVLPLDELEADPLGGRRHRVFDVLRERVRAGHGNAQDRLALHTLPRVERRSRRDELRKLPVWLDLLLEVLDIERLGRRQQCAEAQPESRQEDEPTQPLSRSH